MHRALRLLVPALALTSVAACGGAQRAEDTPAARWESPAPEAGQTPPNTAVEASALDDFQREADATDEALPADEVDTPVAPSPAP